MRGVSQWSCRREDHVQRTLGVREAQAIELEHDLERAAQVHAEHGIVEPVADIVVGQQRRVPIRGRGRPQREEPLDVVVVHLERVVRPVPDLREHAPDMVGALVAVEADEGRWHETSAERSDQRTANGQR